MALSAVIIAAPAAHAADVFPRQDCSRTVIANDDDGKGGLISIVANEVRGGIRDLIGDVDVDKKRETKLSPFRSFNDSLNLDVDDSFNCSNFFVDNFNKDVHHKNYENYDHHYNKYDHHQGYGHGFGHGFGGHGRRGRDHGDRRGHGRY